MTDCLDNWHVRHPGAQRIKGLFPLLNATDPTDLSGVYGIGLDHGSYYDTLVKQYQLMQGAQGQYKRMYEAAASSITRFLLRPISVVGGFEGLLAAGDMHYPKKEEEEEEEPVPFYASRLDHPSASAGAMLGLGAKLFSRPADLETARRLTDTYIWINDATRTGLAPENVQFWDEDNLNRWDTAFHPDGTQYKLVRGDPVGVLNSNNYFLHRPHTVQSLLYLWRMTGERRYQDQGWRMFCSWVQATIAPAGFARLHDVNSDAPRKDDSPVDSGVFATTLKYYFLLFSDLDLLSLDDYVYVSPHASPSPPSHPVNPLLPDIRRPLAPHPETRQHASGRSTTALEGQAARAAGGADRGGHDSAAVGAADADVCGQSGRGGVVVKDSENIA